MGSIRLIKTCHKTKTETYQNLLKDQDRERVDTNFLYEMRQDSSYISISEMRLEVLGESETRQR